MTVEELRTAQYALPTTPAFTWEPETSIPAAATGLYSSEVRKVMLVVNSKVYETTDLRDRVLRYANDINRSLGCEVSIFSAFGGTAQDLKTAILANADGLDGVVLIGDLPRAFYQTVNDYSPSWPTRIYEMEVYGPASATNNLALGRSATSSKSCNDGEAADKAFNGIPAAGARPPVLSDKWCGNEVDPQVGFKWIRVDLGQRQQLSNIVIKHAGAGGEDPRFNAYEFTIEVSDDDSAWTEAAHVNGNVADVTTVTLSSRPFARYVRLKIVMPTQPEPDVNVFLDDTYFMDLDGTWEDNITAWFGARTEHPDVDVTGQLTSRTEHTIGLPWNGIAAPAGLVLDHFSVQWLGSLTPTQPGRYQFHITGNGGFRLWVDGQLLLNQWRNGALVGPVPSPELYLESGEHAIRVDYAATGTAIRLNLEWARAGGPYVPIASSELASGAGVEARYYNNIDLLPHAIPGFGQGPDGMPDRHVGDILPEIFVSRIDASTLLAHGNEYDLLRKFFDKDHRYWAGEIPLKDRSALVHYNGTPPPGPSTDNDRFLAYDAVNSIFDATHITTDKAQAADYLAAAVSGDFTFGFNANHGDTDKITIGGSELYGRDFMQQNLKNLYQDFHSCNSMKSHDGVQAPFASSVGSAFIFGGTSASESNSLMAMGYSVIGGLPNVTNTDTGPDYTKWWGMGKGLPIGGAIREFLIRKTGTQVEELEVRGLVENGVPIGNVPEWRWVGNYHPVLLQGDPLIVLQEVPQSPRSFRTRFDVQDATVILRSHALPGQSVSFDYRYVKLTPSDTCTGANRRHCQFRIVPGLVDPKEVSFESVLYPGAYLHYNSNNNRVLVEQNPNTEDFRRTATFRLLPGLGTYRKASLAPHGLTGQYVQVANGTLVVGSSANASAATFQIEVDHERSRSLAVGTTVTGDSSSSSLATAAKAIDGNIKYGERWYSTGSSKWLQVDLLTEYDITALGLAHAGAGGESASLNTRGFKLQTSRDGSSWTTVVDAVNTQDYSIHPIPRTTARYVKLLVTWPTQSTLVPLPPAPAPAARIYELEVFGEVGATTNLARGKPTTADSWCNPNETPDKAVNGSVSGGISDKWCSFNSTGWLSVDLGRRFELTDFVLRHAGAGGEKVEWNTRAFVLETSLDGSAWTEVDRLTDNTQSSTSHVLDSSTPARYARLRIINPTSSSTDRVTRIYELEAYGAEY